MRQNHVFHRAALAAALLGGVCAAHAADDSATPETAAPAVARQIRVVATIFPAWDWAREVVGADRAKNE